MQYTLEDSIVSKRVALRSYFDGDSFVATLQVEGKGVSVTVSKQGATLKLAEAAVCRLVDHHSPSRRGVERKLRGIAAKWFGGESASMEFINEALSNEAV